MYNEILQVITTFWMLILLKKTVHKFIGPPIRLWCVTVSLHLQSWVPCFNMKTVFLGIRITTMKIWWSLSSTRKDCNCQCHLRVWYMMRMQIYFHVSMSKFSLTRFNSSPLSPAYMHQWIGSALVQIMACRLFATKPLYKPALDYYQLDS